MSSPVITPRESRTQKDAAHQYAMLREALIELTIVLPEFVKFMEGVKCPVESIPITITWSTGRQVTQAICDAYRALMDSELIKGRPTLAPEVDERARILYGVCCQMRDEECCRDSIQYSKAREEAGVAQQEYQKQLRLFNAARKAKREADEKVASYTLA